MLTIVDYGRSNLYSLGQAMLRLGVEHRVSDDPAVVRAADQLLLPGVGAFGDAMAGLRDRGLDAALVEAAGNGAALLGICVGMQLLMTTGEEFGVHPGLGLVPGVARRLPDPPAASDWRVPNMGWRRIAMPQALAGRYDGRMVYFAHSYAAVVSDPDMVVAATRFGDHDVPALVRHGTVVGFQFHPEKSAEVGLALLRDYVTGDLLR